MKNLNLLYFSPTDGTKKVVKEIANGIGSEYKEFDITLAQNRTQELFFDENDLVIIGVPTYAGRFPKLLKSSLDKISCNKAMAVFAVTYGNRDYEDSLLETKYLFESKGFVGLAGAVFVAEHSSTSKLATNRPNSDDLKIAYDFGVKIKDRLESLNDVSELKLEVPGNFPYVEKNLPQVPMAPETDDTCVNCKICAKHCPTSAIDLEDCKKIDPTKCIRCCSCVKRCPFNSKKFTHPGFTNMKNMLETNFADVVRMPEIFVG